MVTVITRTIDAAGAGDYTTFTAAEAAAPTLGTSSDLVANDEAIVFECVAGTYSERASFSSSMTCDATRNVTYRAASGSEHGGDLNSGVIIESTLSAVVAEEDHLVLDGLVLKSTGSYVMTTSAEGMTFRNLIMSGGTSAVTIIQQPSGSTLANTFENCLSYNTGGYGYYVFGTSNPSKVVIRNCTNIVSSGSYGIRNYGGLADLELHNYLGIVTSGAAYQAVGGPAISGSATSISSAAGSIPSSQQLDSTGWTFTTDTAAVSTGSQVIYESGTGKLWDVVGNDAWHALDDLTDAPAEGITGQARSGSDSGGAFNPGAFEAGALLPPTALSSPSPADAATNVANDVDFTWTDGANSPTAWAVYLSAAGPTFTGANLISSSASPADPGTLAYATTYYWRVDQTNAAGTTTGAVFSFTTETEPVAVGVWDAPMSEHTTAGSFGEALQQMKLAVTSLAASRLSS